MEDVSALVPTPILEQILVYWTFFDEDVLGQLGGVIVEEIAQNVNNLCDSLSEERILLRKFFRESYQALEGPSLGESKRCV